MPHKDPAAAKAYHHRRYLERKANGGGYGPCARCRDAPREKCGPYCAECRREWHRQRAADPEYRKGKAAYQRQMKLNDPRGEMLRNARRRAKRDGLLCTISKNDIVIPDVCPVLGIPLRKTAPRRPPPDDAPTLDKLIPEKGYVPGNVTVISWRANTLKRDGTIDEFRRLLGWLESKSSPV